MIYTDFHVHILPSIDDGSPNIDTSIEMLTALRQQQVTSVFATPHFRLHKTDVSSFVAARKNSYESLVNAPQFYKGLPKIYPAAEVAIEPEISKQDCLSLCYENLSAILLELPRTAYKDWMYREIENIRYEFKVVPVLAHLERYLWYERDDLQNLLQIQGIAVQINAGAFERRSTRKLIQEMYEQSIPVIVGTDSHNCNSRAPNFNIVDCTLKKFRFRKWESWFQKNQDWFLSQKRM